MSIIKSYKKYSKLDNTVDLKIYCKIAAEYNKFLISKVLDGHIVTLPSRLGTLYISGRKQKIRLDENGKIKNLPPDWVKTKKLWDSNPEAKKNKTLLYHMNEHSDNIRYKFLWSKLRVSIENKTLYALRMSRTNKRAVHHKIKEGKNYIVNR